MPKVIDYELTRGDTTPLRKFRVTDLEKNVLQLTDNEQLYFTLKTSSNSNTPLIQKKIGDGIELQDDGYYHITLESDDTNSLEYGDYQYDIEFKSIYPKTIVKTLVMGTITLTDEITWKGDE